MHCIDVYAVLHCALVETTPHHYLNSTEKYIKPYVWFVSTRAESM